jgi:hypothetical protein
MSSGVGERDLEPSWHPFFGFTLTSRLQGPGTDSSRGKRGATLAKVPVFDDGNCPATAVAEESSEVLFLSKPDVQRSLIANPTVALNALRLMAGRLRRHAELVGRGAFGQCGEGDRLAGRGVCGTQLIAGNAPDPFDALAGVGEDCSRCQRDEGHQQGVFDQVLALLVPQEMLYRSHCRHRNA